MRTMTAAAVALSLAGGAGAQAQGPVETALIGDSWLCDFGVQQYRPHAEGFTQSARVFEHGDHLTLYRATGGGRFDIVTLNAPTPSDTSTAVMSDGGATLVETGADGATTFTVRGDALVIASVFESTGEQTYACARVSDAEGDAAVEARRAGAGAEPAAGGTSAKP